MKLPIFKKPSFSADQSFEAVPQIVKKSCFSWRVKLSQLKETDKKIKLLLVLIPITLLLVLLSSTVGRNQEKNGDEGTSSSHTPIQSPAINLFSEYATHSAILKTEQELEKIEKEMGQADLNEASLAPPVLEWQIEF